MMSQQDLQGPAGPTRRGGTDEERARARDQHLREQLSGVLERVEAGELVRMAERAGARPWRWGAHSCLLDRDCRRDVGLVPRASLSSPNWWLDVALLPGGRFMGLPGDRRLHWWVLRPRVGCGNVTELRRRGGLLTGLLVCPRRRGHRGACRAGTAPVAAPRLVEET